MSKSMSINRLLNLNSPSQYQRQLTIGTTRAENKLLLIQDYCGSHLTHITRGLSRQGKILVIISDVCFHVIASFGSVLTILALKLLAFLWTVWTCLISLKLLASIFWHLSRWTFNASPSSFDIVQADFFNIIHRTLYTYNIIYSFIDNVLGGFLSQYT